MKLSSYNSLALFCFRSEPQRVFCVQTTELHGCTCQEFWEQICHPNYWEETSKMSTFLLVFEELLL